MPLPPFTLSRFSFDSSNQPLRHESVDVHDANAIDLYLYTLVRHQCGRFGVSFRISNKTKMTINSKKRRNVTNKSALVSIFLFYLGNDDDGDDGGLKDPQQLQRCNRAQEEGDSGDETGKKRQGGYSASVRFTFSCARKETM